MRLTQPASVMDYRALAKRRLPRGFFDYIDGGSYEEITLRANCEDFGRIRLRQKVLRDVSKLDTSVEVLGRTSSLPLILAPVGMAGMFSPRAEVAAAKVAEATGIPMCLSTVSICSIEEVRAATNAPFWFQLYMMRDRDFIKELVGRAQKAGCAALAVTVDLAVLGSRYRDVRNGLAGNMELGTKIGAALDFASKVGWIKDVAIGGQPLIFGNLAAAVPGARNVAAFREFTARQFDASITWKDVEWLRSIWNGPLIVKGVLEPDDARAAIDSGATGVIVSNHGGRQLDSVSSTIGALPAIVEALKGRGDVFIDGGIRTGMDIAKALALGATSTMAGRAWVYPMAARGAKGLSHALAIMRGELEISLALMGVTRARDLSRDNVAL